MQTPPATCQLRLPARSISADRQTLAQQLGAGGTARRVLLEAAQDQALQRFGNVQLGALRRRGRLGPRMVEQDLHRRVALKDVLACQQPVAQAADGV